jgi:hypothetical protein
MSEPTTDSFGLRASLIEMLRAARAAERDVFAAVDPGIRDLPAADGGWSAKDVQAHLSAWRHIQVERLAAIREGRDEPPAAAAETDAVNAVLHAERAAWSWDRVVRDAEATADQLIAEVEAAGPATLEDGRICGTILGNGPEHALAHLPRLAEQTGLDARLLELADALAAAVDGGGWPSRAAAYARYNLACFHALGGRLPVARALLRLALPGDASLRALAPEDDDLIALRDELPSLADG